MTPKTPEIRAIWQKVEEKHNKFHEYGKEVVNFIRKEDYAAAKKKYEEAENYSKELIAEFEQMKAIAVGLQG